MSIAHHRVIELYYGEWWQRKDKDGFMVILPLGQIGGFTTCSGWTEACFTSLKAQRECHLLARVWRKCVFQIIEDICLYGYFSLYCYYLYKQTNIFSNFLKESTFLLSLIWSP